MKDIETREDILLIMRKFYDKLLADDSINFFFTKVTAVDQHVEAHFEILATFWEQSLFLKGGYFNNMFSIHKYVHDKYAFKKEHFENLKLLFHNKEMPLILHKTKIKILNHSCNLNRILKKN